MVMGTVMGQVEQGLVAARMNKSVWVSLCKISRPASIAMAMILAMPYSVDAGEWKSKASITFGEIYTDNVELDDDNKESKFISVVRPTIELEGKGRRAEMSLVGAFEFNNVGGGADSFNPRVRGDAAVELLEDFFFIEGDIYSNQTLIDPFAASGSTQLNRSDNVTTTYDYSISPYLVHRFARFADLQVRYTYDDQINKGDELSDSVRRMSAVTLNSGPDFGPLSWTLRADHQKTEFDGDGFMSQDGDNERSTASVRLGYALDRKWQVNGTLGQEWNNFQTFDDDNTDGDFWDVGLVWTPNRRTTFDFGYGKHFFGTTPRFKFTHTTRRTSLAVNYSRSITDTRSERRAASLFPGEDPFGDLIDPITGEPLFLTDNLTFRDQGIFVNELFDASLTLKGKRSDLTFFVRESKQLREDIDSDAKFTSTGIRFNRKLSSKISVTSRLSLDERENRATSESEITRFYLSLDRQLGPKTTVTLGYSFSDRDAEGFGRDYKENRLNLGLTIDF